MKKKKSSKNKIITWVKNHVRPYVKFTKPRESEDELSWDNKEDVERNIKERVVLGFKIKWKF